jgi:hypothetical protein
VRESDEGDASTDLDDLVIGWEWFAPAFGDLILTSCDEYEETRFLEGEDCLIGVFDNFLSTHREIEDGEKCDLPWLVALLLIRHVFTSRTGVVCWSSRSRLPCDFFSSSFCKKTVFLSLRVLIVRCKSSGLVWLFSFVL